MAQLPARPRTKVLVVAGSALVALAILAAIGIFAVRGVGGGPSVAEWSGEKTNAAKVVALDTSLQSVGSSSALDDCSAVGDAADALAATDEPGDEGLKAKWTKAVADAQGASKTCVDAVTNNDSEALLSATQQMVTAKESIADLQSSLKADAA